MPSAFCSGSYLNWTELWLSDRPIISSCFQRLCPLSISCVFCILGIILLFVTQRPPNQSTALVKKKRHLCHLMVRSLIDIAWMGVCVLAWILDPITAETATTITWSLIIASGCANALLTWMNFRREWNSVCVTSCQFVFHCLFLVAYTPTLYSHIVNPSEGGGGTALIGVDAVIMLLSLLNVVMSVALSPLKSLHDETANTCPEAYAELPSKLSFAWIDSLIWKSRRQTMQDEDVFDLRPCDKVKPNFERFQQTFLAPSSKKTRHRPKLEKDESTPLLSIANKHLETNPTPPTSEKQRVGVLQGLLNAFGTQLLLAGALTLGRDLITLLNPFLLNLIITEFSMESFVIWRPLLLGVLFFLSGIGSSVLQEMNNFYSNTLALRCQSALTGAVFRKSIQLNSESRQGYSSGEIVNIMSIDVPRIAYAGPMFTLLLSSPVLLVLALLLLWQQLGLATLPGLGVFVFCLPVNGLLMSYVRKQETIQMQWKDSRLKLLSDILNGIRILKLYAWEGSFEKRIQKHRLEEVRALGRVEYAFTPVIVLWEVVPFIVTCVSLLTYVYMDNGSNVLTANRAFVSMALFTIIKMPMTMVPSVLTRGMNALVSLKRLNEFLNKDEIDLTGFERTIKPQLDQPAVQISRGTFSWKAGEAILWNIDLSIQPKQFIAVVGKIGVGKSSLLSALVGDMHRESGNVSIHGQLAYVPQTSWIQHQNVQGNILFGGQLDPAWYNTVLDKCALRPDIEILPKGDKTLIGERGINLSGGQKQRISLARAVYLKADIYLMDDPLSAVDAHVGKELFQNLLAPGGLLAEKTRILVTHSLQWLPMVDEIIVLGENGQIVERGSYTQLMQNGQAFAEVVQNNQYRAAEQPIAEVTTMQRQISAKSNMRPLSRQVSSNHSKQGSISSFGGKFSTLESIVDETNLDGVTEIKEEDEEDNEEEKINEGRVSMKIYLDYLRARGYITTAVCLLFYTLLPFSNILSNIWIQLFTENPIIVNASASASASVSFTQLEDLQSVTNYYMTAYVLTGSAQVLFSGLLTLCHVYASLKAARTLHFNLLHHILRAPLAFFDTTPNGRIVNRFSKDISSVDDGIPNDWHYCLRQLFAVLFSIGAIVYSTPWFLLAILPLAAMYFAIQVLYYSVARQTRRLGSTTRSPIFTHFSESLAGVSVIRACTQTQRFVDTSDQLVNKNAKFTFLSQACNCWLSFRLGFLGAIIVFAAVLFAVLAPRSSITAALVGLSITYALSVTDSLHWLVVNSSHLETEAVSVERIMEYTHVESEGEWIIQDHHNLPALEDWPQQGNVVMQQYSARYRAGLPLVLKDLQLHIKAAEKVGIVGRTGAGKSSLTLALFRLLTVKKGGGSIHIDGVDIHQLGLHQLRGKITILPQDPILFHGTLRENLDPFEVHTDAQLWGALESAHLRDWAGSLVLGLSHECGEGGQNLSVGQRQLICLARALLKKSKVLILDEATAAVDQDTDRLIMQTIFQEFRHSTVLIIAHRLNTILNTDRVVVMSDGAVAESGPPRKLMHDSTTLFHSMVKEAGLLEEVAANS